MKAPNLWPSVGDDLQVWVDDTLVEAPSGFDPEPRWVDGFKVVSVREPVGPTPGPLRLMVSFSLEKVVGGKVIAAHNVGLDRVRMKPSEGDHALIGRKVTRCMRVLGVATNSDGRWGHVTYQNNLDVDLPIARLRDMVATFREHDEQGTLANCFRSSIDDEDCEVLSRVMATDVDGRIQEPSYYATEFSGKPKLEFAWEDLDIYTGNLAKQNKKGDCKLENKKESWVCNDVSVARIRQAGAVDKEDLFGQKVRGYRHIVGRVSSCYKKNNRSVCLVLFEDGSQILFKESIIRNAVQQQCVVIDARQEIERIENDKVKKTSKRPRDITSPVSHSTATSTGSDGSDGIINRSDSPSERKPARTENMLSAAARAVGKSKEATEVVALPSLDLSHLGIVRDRRTARAVLTTKIERRAHMLENGLEACSVCRADDDQSFLIQCSVSCRTTWHVFCLPSWFPCNRPFACPSCMACGDFIASSVRVYNEPNDSGSLDARPEFLVPGKGWVDRLPAVMVADHAREITTDPMMLATMLDRSSLYIRILEGGGQTSWHFLNGAPVGISQYTELADVNEFVTKYLKQQVEKIRAKTSKRGRFTENPSSTSVDLTSEIHRRPGTMEFSSSQKTAVHLLIRALERSSLIGDGKIVSALVCSLVEGETEGLNLISGGTKDSNGNIFVDGQSSTAVWVQLTNTATIDLDHVDQEIEAPHRAGDITRICPSALGAFDVSVRTSVASAMGILFRVADSPRSY